MRQWKMLSLCGLMIFAGLAVSQAAPPFGFAKPKSEIQWADDIFAAHKLSQSQNKPMLLVFGADWCGYCKKLEQQTLTQPQLVEYINKTYIAVHLDEIAATGVAMEAIDVLGQHADLELILQFGDDGVRIVEVRAPAGIFDLVQVLPGNVWGGFEH